MVHKGVLAKIMRTTSQASRRECAQQLLLMVKMMSTTSQSNMRMCTVVARCS